MRSFWFVGGWMEALRLTGRRKNIRVQQQNKQPTSTKITRKTIKVYCFRNNNFRLMILLPIVRDLWNHRLVGDSICWYVIYMCITPSVVFICCFENIIDYINFRKSFFDNASSDSGQLRQCGAEVYGCCIVTFVNQILCCFKYMEFL